MKQNTKKIISNPRFIIFALTLLGVIIFALFMTYNQTLRFDKFHPKYNFLIVTSSDNINPFYVDNGKLTLSPTLSIKNQELFSKTKLEIYDVQKYQKIPITYEEAEKLILSTNLDSPDGFYLSQRPPVNKYSLGIGSMDWFLENRSDTLTKKLLFTSYISVIAPSTGTEFIGWIID